MSLKRKVEPEVESGEAQLMGKVVDFRVRLHRRAA